MKNYYCLQICSILIITLAVAALNSYAQQNYKRANLSICDINEEQGGVAKKEKSDISIRISARNNYADINDDGSVIVADGKLLFWDSFGLVKRDVPGHNFFGRKLRLDGSGNLFAYHHHDSKAARITFVNTNTFQVDTEYVVEKSHELENIVHFDISKNAKTIAYSYLFGDGREKVCVVDRKGQEFSEPAEIAVTELVTQVYLSSNGNRVFFNATVLDKITVDGFQRTVNKYRSFWSERKGNEWTPAAEFNIPNASRVIITDVAKDGDTVLFKDQINGLGIAYKEEEGWSNAEFLGILPSPYDRMEISEDGQTIASTITYLTTTLSGTKEYNTEFKILHMNDAQSFKKHDLILDASEIIGGEFLLSKNGKKLIYTPYEITD